MEQENQIRFQVRENNMALFAGVFAIGAAIAVLVLRLLYPSAEDIKMRSILFYPVLLLMAGTGTFCCVKFFLRGLSVEEMNLYYVNSMKKRKDFNLDGIGYCKISFLGRGSGKNFIALYDLVGDELCKLDFSMRGTAELLEYLRDNQVKIEYTEKTRQYLSGLGYSWNDTDICQEQIAGCADMFYEAAKEVVQAWEKKNNKFGVCWEFGLAEFAEKDLRQEKNLWECKSSVQRAAGEEALPEDYVCVLEGFLKKGGEYVIDKHGEAVAFFVSYIERSKSYQVGEGLKLRKRDEGFLLEELRSRLEWFTWKLPREKYHTENLTLQHDLKMTAGV